MTPAEIRGRLRGVTRDGRSSYCPAHEGDGKSHRPSLSIAGGQDGRVLLKCHAGCSTESIVQAIGLPMAALFASPPLAPTSRPDNGFIPESEIVTTYDYTNLDGMVLYQAVRYTHHRFKLRRPSPN